MSDMKDVWIFTRIDDGLTIHFQHCRGMTKINEKGPAPSFVAGYF